MQTIVWCPVGRAERSTTLFAAIAAASTLRGDIEKVANDVTFADLSREGAVAVGTGTRQVPFLIHTCLLTENASKIQ
jgi:hypothetical protein